MRPPNRGVRMLKVEVSDRFAIEELRPREGLHPGPPGPGQVLLRMKAVGLNYRDLMVATGYDRWRPPVGRIVCSDGVGIVEAVGKGVTRFEPGDMALTTLLPNWISGTLTAEKRDGGLGGPAADGVLAQFVRIDAEALVRPPRHLTAVESATLPAAGVTAWHVLTRADALRSDATIVVGGTGGVSLFAIKLALAAGARVIVTSSSDAKLDRVRAMGAYATVNYAKRADWGDEVVAITDGAGVDLVVDIGGAASLAGSIRAAGINGVVSVVGLVGGLQATIDLAEVFQKNLRLDGIETGSRSMVEEMIDWMEAHHVRPVVDRTFEMADAPAAFEHLRSGSPFGKVCIVL